MCNNNIQKVSIRFFNDREVRAVWDETLSKWWFSVLATNQLKLLAQDGKRYKTDVLDTEGIPSVRRNPVIADIFAQLGYMERKGSGMGKIIIRLKPFPTLRKRCFQPSSPIVPSFLSRSPI